MQLNLETRIASPKRDNLDIFVVQVTYLCALTLNSMTQKEECVKGLYVRCFPVFHLMKSFKNLHKYKNVTFRLNSLSLGTSH